MADIRGVVQCAQFAQFKVAGKVHWQSYGALIVKMVLCQAENELLASLHIEQHSRTCKC